MNSEELLKAVVNFYRAYKQFCSIKDGYFTVENAILNETDSWNGLAGVEFVQLKVNKTPINIAGHQALSVGDEVSFTIITPNLIFENIDDLIVRYNPLQKGMMPGDLYIRDVDVLLSEGVLSDQLENLSRICRFIKFLEKVLPHTENTSTARGLKFVIFSGAKESKKNDKKTFYSRFTVHELDARLDKLNFILALDDNDDLHSYERVTVFQSALYELVSQIHDNDSTFAFILKHFDRLVELYKNNYETYINNFHLEDFKKEVVESHSKFSDEIDSKVNDLVTKFIAAPAISTALLFFKSTNSSGAGDNILVGAILFIVFLIIVSQIKWNLESLEQIECNVRDVFKKFEQNKEEGGVFVANKRGNLLSRLEKASFLAYSFGALSLVLCVMVFFLL
jgi:hypothetical protein